MAANLTLTSTLLPGTLHRETEFVAGLTGACGPNMLGMAWSWSTQARHTTLETYQAMRAHGLCDPNGASTIGELRAAALLLGLPLADYRAYAEPWPDWRDWFAFHLARGRAIGFETANGQALVDALSGHGENARNLRYHFLLVAGWHPGGLSARAGRDLPAGWWCADGDNFASGDVLQFYPDTVLAASLPCAAIAIGAKVTMSNPYVVVKGPDGSDWYKDTRTGKEIGGGIYRYATMHNLPPCIQGERKAPNGRDSYAIFGDPTRQHAGDRKVFWDASRSPGVAREDWQGTTIDLQEQVDQLNAKLAALAASAPTTSASEEATKALEVVKSIKSQVASF